MIIGIGIDLTDIKRFSNKNRLAEKIMTAYEYNEYKNLPISLKSTMLAKTWAVKEALYKALPENLQSTISWKNAELVRDSYGRPQVTIKNVNVKIHASLSDEGDMVTAIIILEEC
jgi:holo-[acyl-carrier protein] synthase